MPSGEASEPIIEEHIHVSNHPLHALTVVVVPGAETTSLLGPDVNHFTNKVSWVSHDRRHGVCESHEAKLAPVVADVVVGPEQEELVLQEDVVTAEQSPVQELVESDWHSTSEQIGWALLDWDSKQSLGW